MTSVRTEANGRVEYLVAMVPSSTADREARRACCVGHVAGLSRRVRSIWFVVPISGAALEDPRERKARRYRAAEEQKRLRAGELRSRFEQLLNIAAADILGKSFHLFDCIAHVARHKRRLAFELIRSSVDRLGESLNGFDPTHFLIFS